MYYLIQSMSCDQFCTCAHSQAHRTFKYVAARSSHAHVRHMFACANFLKVIFHLTCVTAGCTCACAQAWLQLILCYLWLIYRQKKTRFLSNIQDFSGSHSMLRPILNRNLDGKQNTTTALNFISHVIRIHLG